MPADIIQYCAYPRSNYNLGNVVGILAKWVWSEYRGLKFGVCTVSAESLTEAEKRNGKYKHLNTLSY
jgi:hypothetical protein